MVRMGGTGARCPSYRATILTIGEHPRRLSRKNELRALGRTGLPEGDVQGDRSHVKLVLLEVLLDRTIRARMAALAYLWAG